MKNIVITKDFGTGKANAQAGAELTKIIKNALTQSFGEDNVAMIRTGGSTQVNEISVLNRWLKRQLILRRRNKMGVKINGKEVTKEEFRELMLKRVAQQKEVKKLSKTEFGREILRQKGIKPID